MLTGIAGVLAAPNTNAIRVLPHPIAGAQTYCWYWSPWLAAAVVHWLLHTVLRLFNRLFIACSDAMMVEDEPVSSNIVRGLLLVVFVVSTPA